MKDLASTKLNNTTGQVVEAGAETPEEQEEEESLVDLGRLEGMLDEVSDSSSIKSISPRTFKDQIKVEDAGSTKRLWIYVLGSGWHNTTLS